MMTPNSVTAQIIPSGGDDTDMFVGGTIPVMPTSQNTAITNWSSAPITDWPATPSSFQKREALAALSKRCPHVNEDVLIIALEEHNFVVDDATDLLLGIGMDDAMSAFLIKVFPKVPRSIINDQLSNCYGRYLEMFASCNKTGRWPALFLTLSLTLWRSLHYITLLYITLGRAFITLLYSTLFLGGLFITLHFSSLLGTLFFTLLFMCALYCGRWWSLFYASFLVSSLCCFLVSISTPMWRLPDMCIPYTLSI